MFLSKARAYLREAPLLLLALSSNIRLGWEGLVSYPMLRMTHPPRNFFVLCSRMFVWLRGQGFEISVNKLFQKEKLVNSKTIRFTILYKGVSSARASLVQACHGRIL
jgi:hypothetical protein